MSGKDQFADLFSSATKKKDNSNLSLLERQKLSSSSSSFNNIHNNNNTVNIDQWADFDLLSGSNSIKPINTPNNYSQPQQQSDDFFEGFGSSNISSSTKTAQPISNDDLFEGFGLSSSTNAKSQPTQQANDFDIFNNSSNTQNNQPVKNPSQEIDDLFAVFDKLPTQQNEQPIIENPKPFNPRNNSHLLNGSSSSSPRPRQASPTINIDARDESIASLIDMGFDVDQANDALNHTSDGINVQEAISYIMTSAHDNSRAKQGLPPQERTSSAQSSSLRFGNGKTPEQYLNNFSNILGSVGNKVFSEANKYFNSTSSTSNGKPAWMKDQARHKANNRHYEEDPDELDEETIRRLTLQEHERNRQRDRQRQQERNQHAQPSRTETSSVPISSTKQSEPIMRPHSTRPPQSQQQEEVIDIFSTTSTSSRVPVGSKKLKPEPEIDLFSSPAPPKKTFNNEEMKTSSRRRATRSTPISTTASNVNRLRTAQVSISSTQMEFFKDSREQGGISFKNGDFVNALTHYQTALDALPQNHPLRIIAYSNCITAYSKVGENKKVIELSELANELIGPERGQNEDIEAGKPIKEFWIKINIKKAESLEHIEKFKDALSVWIELIENGATSKIALDGKRRCQKFIEPKPATSKPKSAAKSSQQSIHLRKPQPAPRPENSEALKKIQKANQESEQFEQDKFKLYDAVEYKVNSWKNAKEDNLRALLSSLQNILWESTNWKPVNMSDLVIPKKVKIVYLKAVAKVHPDKIPQNATSEQKLIAQSVFVTINKAWETFKQQNGIQ